MSRKELVVITGASQGIGLALAKAFAQEGHPLLLISRHMKPIDELAHNEVIYEKVDVANFKALEKAIHNAEKKFGTTGCLINNAGILKVGDFKTVDLDSCYDQIDVLFKGVIHGIKAVLPQMAAQKKGTIINISSIGDRKPAPTGEIYNASKAAVKSLSESLQLAEGKNNVRIINLAPAFIKTNIHSAIGISFEEYSKIFNYPDFLTPEEFAQIVLFCWKLPQKICIRDMVVMPTNASF